MGLVYLFGKKLFLTRELSLINTCCWRADHETSTHDGEAGVHQYSYPPDNKSVNQRQFTSKEKLFRFQHNKKRECKHIATFFFLRIILKTRSTEAHVYMRRHQGAKVKTPRRQQRDVSQIFTRRRFLYAQWGKH